MEVHVSLQVVRETAVRRIEIESEEEEDHNEDTSESSCDDNVVESPRSAARKLRPTDQRYICFCMRSTTHGFPGHKRWYCGRHAREGMVRVVCDHSSHCSRHAEYAQPTDTHATRCDEHSEDGMVLKVGRRCRIKPCTSVATHNLPHQPTPLWCAAHGAAQGAVNVLMRFCACGRRVVTSERGVAKAKVVQERIAVVSPQCIDCFSVAHPESLQAYNWQELCDPLWQRLLDEYEHRFQCVRVQPGLFLIDQGPRWMVLEFHEQCSNKRLEDPLSIVGRLQRLLDPSLQQKLLRLLESPAAELQQVVLLRLSVSSSSVCYGRLPGGFLEIKPWYKERMLEDMLRQRVQTVDHYLQQPLSPTQPAHIVVDDGWLY